MPMSLGDRVALETSISRPTRADDACHSIKAPTIESTKNRLLVAMHIGGLRYALSLFGEGDATGTIG